MQLSNLKKFYIQNSLSKSIELRKKADIQIKIIELYKEKYSYEVSDEVGISLAAEEVKKDLNENDIYYRLKLEAVSACILQYLKVEEISILSQRVDLNNDFSLKNFYKQLKARCPNEMKRAKKEDIIKAYSLLEVARDSANSDNG